jgi:hypothetical protein
MQEILKSVNDEVSRVVSKPPSRPIRLMFFSSPMLYSFIQNKIIDMFRSNEVLNLNDFFDSDEFINVDKELNQLEESYGIDSKKFQRKLSETLYDYITSFIKNKHAKKILVMEDSDLYSYHFDPIHFLGSYIFDDNSIIVQKEIPTFWVTVGQRDPYNLNIYRYYKTNDTKGRKLELKQSNFGSCVIDYTAEY